MNWKNKVMKSLLLLCLFTFLPLTTQAAPAWPFPFKVKQPDGTVLTVRLHGDEHFNWVTTTDDILLTTKDNAYYVAEISDDGQLTAGNLLAHDQLLRSTDEQTAIQRQAPRRALFAERSSKLMATRRAPQVTYGSYFPHTGEPRVLVILAAYADKGFTLKDPKESFGQYLNGETQKNLGHRENLNYCSVAKYFETVSHGQFKPQFDIVGPVTLPQNLAYYGNTSSPNNEKIMELCQDAVNAALAANRDLDVTLYDNNGDGNIELVYVVHAGYGENTSGPKETMWAKVSSLSGVTANGKTISYGGCQSELMFNDQYYEDYVEKNPDAKNSTPWINGIGPFCHEFSHSLGLPDLYVTTTAAQKTINQSMQAWDVMDYGIYNNSGYRPAAYTAWEQEAMGWISIEELTEPTTNLSLTPVIDGGTAYKIQNPDKPNEYIVLENIQKKGLNGYAKGHGLLAYHVDYNSNNVYMGDNPNNTVGHPRVAVIPSGGLQFSTYCIDQTIGGVTYTEAQWNESHAATPFPGTKSVTLLTDEQALPNFYFYEGSTANKKSVGHRLYGITEDTSAGTVTFNYDMEGALTLTDGESITDLLPYAGQTCDIIYKRAFTQDKMATICLPFDYKKQAGETIYTFKGIEKEGDKYIATMQEVNTETLTANTPYMYLPAATGEVDFSGTYNIPATIEAGETTVDDWTFKGTFDKQQWVEAPATDIYGFSAQDVSEQDISQGQFVKVGAMVEIPALRCYIEHKQSSTPAPLQTNRRADGEELPTIIYLRLLDASGHATAIGSVQTATGSVTFDDSAWYSLNGTRLTGKPTQKGVYINQGKKIVIK